jgi:rhodanese-related sulfurtransferase
LVAAKLRHAGYNAYNVNGGLVDWEAAEYPLDRSRKAGADLP